jgi:hypothetical protein
VAAKHSRSYRRYRLRKVKKLVDAAVQTYGAHYTKRKKLYAKPLFEGGWQKKERFRIQLQRVGKSSAILALGIFHWCLAS